MRPLGDSQRMTVLVLDDKDLCLSEVAEACNAIATPAMGKQKEEHWGGRGFSR